MQVGEPGVGRRPVTDEAARAGEPELVGRGREPVPAGAGRLLMREVARVLRPGGRWVFAVTHPIRWVFLDDPTERGLVVTHS